MIRFAPLLIAIAGCGDAASDSADQVVLAFIRALRDGDEAAAVACLHPECPLLKEDERWKDARQRQSYFDGASRMFRRSRAEVKIILISSAEKDARVDFRIFSPDAGWDAVERTLYLQRVGGAWRIYHGRQWEAYFPRLRAEAAPGK